MRNLHDNQLALLFTFFFSGIVLLFIPSTVFAVDRFVNPGQKIQDVITSAAADDTVVIQDGVYYENLTINKSLTLKAQNPGKVTISGAVNPAATVTFQPEGTTPGLYYTTDITVPVVWVMQGDRSLHDYLDLTSLKNFTLKPKPNGDILPGPHEGFAFDSTTNTLYVILPNNADPRTLPAGQKVEFNRDSVGDGIVVTGGTALNPRKDVTIEGLHLRLWFNSAIDVRAIAEHITIRNNYFEGFRYGVHSSTANNQWQHKDLLVEYNEFSNKPQYDYRQQYGGWLWVVFYNNLFHSQAIHTVMGGVTVRYNFVHDAFNGIQILGQPNKDDPATTTVDERQQTIQNTAPSEVYNNVVAHAADNPLELDNYRGRVSYLRLHHNFILDSYSTLSMTYRNWGTLLVDHNIFYNSPDSLLDFITGWVKQAPGLDDANGNPLPLVNMTVAHNTVVLYWNGPYQSHVTRGGVWSPTNMITYGNSIFENNIILAKQISGSNKYELAGDPSVSGDEFVFSDKNLIRCDITIDVNCDFPSAINDDPDFISGPMPFNTNGELILPATIDFRLQAGSRAINAGVTNDKYYQTNVTDTRPDLGALEAGETWNMPAIGPTWARSYGDISSRPRLPDTLNASWIGFGGFVQPTATPTPTGPTVTPTATHTPIPTPTSGAITPTLPPIASGQVGIRNFSVQNSITDETMYWFSNDVSGHTDMTFALNEFVYSDRSFKFKDDPVNNAPFPAYLTGATYIRTPNDDKGSANLSLSFETDRDAIVYVGLAQGTSTVVPSWLSTWTDTGILLATTDRTFSLYSMQVSANTPVSLRDNNRPSMYTVILVSQATSSVAGDTDQDGDVDISDLSQLLASFGGVNANADFDGNGTVGIGDLAILLSKFGT